MKKLITVLIAATTLMSALAQPINYQGRLSDKSGTNVNGSKNFSLRIFDAKTGGKQIYEENVGGVTVNEGAYSFNFGENGKSVVTPTETIAFADGEKQIFNYTVKNPPVLGEIKISGGGYSWTEAGSSDATKFTATANKNSGAVSAIFLTGAPEAGQDISIAYDHNSDGVMGALSRGGQAWLEITVGGETLSPRERLVSVPYALRSGVADSVINPPEIPIYVKLYTEGWSGDIGDKWNQIEDYHLSPNSKNKVLKYVASFYPRKANNRGGSVRMYIRLMKRDITTKKFKVIAEKYSPTYSVSKFYYDQSVELTNVSVSGFCRIEFGIENVSDSDTGLKILDYGLLLHN